MRNHSEIPVHLQAAGIWVNGVQSVPDLPLANVIFSLGNNVECHFEWVKTLVNGMMEKSFAVLCTDLVTRDEENLYSNQFCIQLNADRLTLLTQWANTNSSTAALPVLYFSYMLGAPAALLSAAGNKQVLGVVSYSGRLELVQDRLQQVKQPVLLIHGNSDSVGKSLSQESCAAIGGIAEVQAIAGKGHPVTTSLVELLQVTMHWFNGCIHKQSKPV